MKYILLTLATLVSCCPAKTLPRTQHTEYLKCQDIYGNKYVLIIPAFGPVEIIKYK